LQKIHQRTNGGDSGPARNTAAMRSYRITHILPCLADPDKIRAIVELGEEIHEAFPYINALLTGCIYNHAAMILTLKKDGKMITLYPRKVTIAKAIDENDVLGTMEWIRSLLQEVEERKEELQPNFGRGVELKALDIFKLLPGTNCKACGELTCLAFAVEMLSGAISVMRCAPLFTPTFKEKRHILFELLKSAGYYVPI
jgi:ArsR family metal-binding transcriptional regulator